MTVWFKIIFNAGEQPTVKQVASSVESATGKEVFALDEEGIHNSISCHLIQELCSGVSGTSLDGLVGKSTESLPSEAWGDKTYHFYCDKSRFFIETTWTTYEQVTYTDDGELDEDAPEQIYPCLCLRMAYGVSPEDIQFVFDIIKACTTLYGCTTYIDEMSYEKKPISLIDTQYELFCKHICYMDMIASKLQKNKGNLWTLVGPRRTTYIGSTILPQLLEGVNNNREFMGNVWAMMTKVQQFDPESKNLHTNMGIRISVGGRTVSCGAWGFDVNYFMEPFNVISLVDGDITFDAHHLAEVGGEFVTPLDEKHFIIAKVPKEARQEVIARAKKYDNGI